MLQALARRFGIILGVMMLVFVSLSSGIVAAADSAQGLEISPPLIEISSDPGKTETIQVRVRNVTKNTMLLKAQFEDFVAKDETGVPKILLNTKETSPYSVRDWLSAPDNLVLAPGQRQAITVTIGIPANASPGGHYGVVRFTGTSPEIQDTGVSLSASVGTLLLINVSGKVKQSAKIAEIYTSHNNQRGSVFERGPILITTRVQNTGNVHIKPNGVLQIRNIFGKTVSETKFNPLSYNVLPGSIRKFQEQFNKKNLFGRYTAEVDVVYGPNNQIASSSTTFWVIPYKLIVLAILILIGVIAGFKRYNDYIIRRAGKSGGNGKTKSRRKKD